MNLSSAYRLSGSLSSFICWTTYARISSRERSDFLSGSSCASPSILLIFPITSSVSRRNSENQITQRNKCSFHILEFKHLGPLTERLLDLQPIETASLHQCTSVGRITGFARALPRHLFR